MATNGRKRVEREATRRFVLGPERVLDQGFVRDDDANAFFTTAESFDQLQASELSSQRDGFDRSAGCFAIGEDGFLGVNTSGGPTG